MEKVLLLSEAYSVYIALLVVMILIMGLFGFILFIALRPTEYDKYKNESSAEYALTKRETELTLSLLQLLNKESDATKRAELESKLREVKAAQALVASLTEEDRAEAKEALKKPVVKPSQPASKPAAKPAQAQPAAKPAQAQPAEKPAQAQPAAKPAEKPAPVSKPTRAAAAKEEKPASDVKTK